MCAPHSGFAAVQTEEWQSFVTLEYRLSQSYLELWVASSSWLASPGWWQPGTILPTIHKDNELDPCPVRKGTHLSHYQELKILLICHKLGEGYGIHGILEMITYYLILSRAPDGVCSLICKLVTIYNKNEMRRCVENHFETNNGPADLIPKLIRQIQLRCKL